MPGDATTPFLPQIGGCGPERDRRCRAAVASTVVAGLEMARAGALVIEQGTAFGTVVFGPGAA